MNVCGRSMGWLAVIGVSVGCSKELFHGEICNCMMVDSKFNGCGGGSRVSNFLVV